MVFGEGGKDSLMMHANALYSRHIYSQFSSNTTLCFFFLALSISSYAFTLNFVLPIHGYYYFYTQAWVNVLTFWAFFSPTLLLALDAQLPIMFPIGLCLPWALDTPLKEPWFWPYDRTLLFWMDSNLH